ncbi:hypothetical protein KCU63_g28, partial [Aureobasidium melanogenum]
MITFFSMSARYYLSYQTSTMQKKNVMSTFCGLGPWMVTVIDHARSQWKYSLQRTGHVCFSALPRKYLDPSVSTLQALPDMVHAMVDVISLSCVQRTLVLLVRLRCMSLMILSCSSANVTVVVCTVIVLIKLHSHGIKAMMLVPVHVVGQRGVQSNFLLRDGRVLISQKVCPCGIYGWARFAEVKWKIGVQFSVDCVACMIEEEEVVEFDCREFAWQRSVVQGRSTEICLKSRATRRGQPKRHSITLEQRLRMTLRSMIAHTSLILDIDGVKTDSARVVFVVDETLLCIAPRICPCCRTSGGSFVFRIRSVTMSPNAFVAFRSVANHTTREKHCTKISVSLVQCFNCVVLSNKETRWYPLRGNKLSTLLGHASTSQNNCFTSLMETHKLEGMRFYDYSLVTYLLSRAVIGILVDGIVVIVEAERLASLPCRSVESLTILRVVVASKFVWVDEETRTSAQWMNDHDRTSMFATDPLDDDMVTGGLCLVVLAALRGQEAGGDHVASGTVVLVEDVQATFVVVAGVLGRLRDLSSGLAKQSLFLYALLLALSGLAAASVVASLFVSGHDTQLVGEAALVAGVASGAGDGSVTEEDDVEGDEEQEHDESFDGKKLLLCWAEQTTNNDAQLHRDSKRTSKHKLVQRERAFETFFSGHTKDMIDNLISANPQHSSRKNSERTSKRKLQTVDLAISFQLIVNAVPVEMQNKLPSRSLPRERECVCVGAFSVDTARRCQNIMPSDGYLKPCRSRGRSLKCDVSTRAHRPNNLLISYWLSHGLVLVEVQRDLRAVDYAERNHDVGIPHHNKAMASIANEHPFIDRLPLTRKCQSQSLRGEALWTSEVLSLGTASSSTKRRSQLYQPLKP